MDVWFPQDWHILTPKKNNTTNRTKFLHFQHQWWKKKHQLHPWYPAIWSAWYCSKASAQKAQLTLRIGSSWGEPTLPGDVKIPFCIDEGVQRFADLLYVCHLILTLTSATQRSHWHSKHLERHSKRRRSSVGNKSLTTATFGSSWWWLGRFFLCFYSFKRWPFLKSQHKSRRGWQPKQIGELERTESLGPKRHPQNLLNIGLQKSKEKCPWHFWLAAASLYRAFVISCILEFPHIPYFSPFQKVQTLLQS